LFGSAGFGDEAGVEEDDAVGHVAGELHFVGDDDHGHAFFGQVAHDAQDFVAQLGVERAGGFVEEHDSGLHREGAGDGDSLLLAAGELRRVGVGFLVEADFREELARQMFRFGAGHAFYDDGGFGDVFENGEVREEVEGLENHAGTHAELALLFTLRRSGFGPEFVCSKDSCNERQLREKRPPLPGPLLPRRRGGRTRQACRGWLAALDSDAVDGDGAGVSEFELVEATQEGAFAATARADQDDGLSALLLVVNAVENTVTTVRFHELFDGDHILLLRFDGTFGSTTF
jgi:hypothetical protein